MVMCNNKQSDVLIINQVIIYLASADEILIPKLFTIMHDVVKYLLQSD